QRVLVYFGRSHREELIEMVKNEPFFEGEHFVDSEFVAGEIEEKYKRTGEITDLDAAKHLISVTLDPGTQSLLSSGNPKDVSLAKFVNSQIRRLTMEKVKALNEKLKGKKREEIIDATIRFIVD
ncbi:MAG: hypothetical protein Q7K42_02890, partial [Candidatus Diapherotrites archaeon]|nr:hypothetical protein [Candidatus Diapherotrites archaeon]